MNITTLAEYYLKVYGIPLVAEGFVAPLSALLAKDPSLTDAQLVSNEDGSLKHYVRRKIGFFVDLVWPEIEPALDSLLQAAVAIVRGNPPLAA